MGKSLASQEVLFDVAFNKSLADNGKKSQTIAIVLPEELKNEDLTIEQLLELRNNHSESCI